MNEDPVDDGNENAPTRAESGQSLAATSDEPTVGAPRDAPTLSVGGPSTGSGSRSLDTSGPSAGGTTATTLMTAHDTLLAQEASRTRTFVRFVFTLATLLALALPFIPGDVLGRRILMVLSALTALTCGRVALRLRDEATYSIERITAVAYVGVATVTGAMYFFGVFSAAVAVLVWGLYFFSGGQSFRATFGIYFTSAILFFALALATMTGLLPDRGLVTVHGLGVGPQIVFVVLLESIFLMTFLNARATRAATLAAIERHDQVVRNLAQREALLQEAKQELERALDFAGLGRFSDTTVGSFRLGKVIGRGAMGEVYEAVHTAKQIPAAVKLLHTHALADSDIVKRFLREAQIAQTIEVRNVVRVLEFGGLTSPVPYIAMERLHGEDLADYLRRHKQLASKKVVHLVRQVGRGLEAARAAGIVHRDLKPRNLFLADVEGGHEWKILDFGVSKLTNIEATQTHDRVVGTPGYMAPEQATGKPVTHRTDLYALGVIAYRALTGRPAFAGDHVAEILYQVAHHMPPRPSELVQVHEQVDLVLAIAMAKSDRDRFDSGAELAAALEAASEGRLDPTLVARGDRLVAKHPWGEGR